MPKTDEQDKKGTGATFPKKMEPVPIVITGNQAVAWGAFLAKTQVISAYPITPQTTIIEALAELMPKADWPYRFMTVESEHSAMASLIGSSMAAARSFTATSSQGLLLMHELLHWASGARLPIVMANVNRAIAAPWCLWSDQQDSLSQRDTGWAQIYCATAQEALDAVILSFRVAEEIHLPFMIVLDAFTLSHTAEAVLIPSPEQVREFLPPYKPPFKLDVNEPRAFGGLPKPEFYEAVRQRLDRDLKKAESAWTSAQASWRDLTGRGLEAVETYCLEKDTEVAIIASGAAGQTAHAAVDRMREASLKAGLVIVRMFRPFPSSRLREVLAGIPKIEVVDRAFSWGHKGIWTESIQSAFYSLKEDERPKIYGYITGMGGVDITVKTFEWIVRHAISRSEPEPETVWAHDIKENTRGKVLAKK
ncbi:MAG: pyruvate ferredoxin oxidoreductase [Elusimicrobia bacterium]|nr:pyruvate ferredoxin oxidoreductase [Elusimicrobiota bacterium]